MADIKISEMPLSDSLTGEELVPIIQNGTNKTTNINKIKEGTLSKAELTLTPEELEQVLANIGINIGTFATKAEISDMETKSNAAATYLPKGDYATKEELGSINTILDNINGEVI